MGRMKQKQRLEWIREGLVRWFRANRRDLPWRNTKDPYAVWVSEIMLQQTRVMTVLPYYERFMKRFPDVRSLARARVDSVLKLWEGLGYYSRARNLHASAKEVVKRFGGQVPDDREALLSLKGVGRYTAGAILSIAFDKPEPILDGNVARVLSRVMPIRTEIKAPGTQKRLWSIAAQLAEGKKPGDLNQGLMELGAMVCTPRSPDCGNCPIREQCRAYAYGDQEKLPKKAAAKAIPHYTIAVGIIYKDGKFLIAKRKATGLLAGLWELPGGKQKPGEPLKKTLVREVREETGIEIAVGEKLVPVDHAYSHFSITLHPFVCEYRSGTAKPLASQAVRWITRGQVKRYTFPAANHRIFSQLTKRD